MRIKMSETETKIWQLVNDEISLDDFCKSVFDSTELQNSIGMHAYRELIGDDFSDTLSVLSHFDDWSRQIYGLSSMPITSRYKLLRLCRKIEAGSLTSFEALTKLHAASSLDPSISNSNIWDDKDWGAIAILYDSLDIYGIGIDIELLSKEFLSKRERVEAEITPEIQLLCRSLLQRFSESKSAHNKLNQAGTPKGGAPV